MDKPYNTCPQKRCPLLHNACNALNRGHHHRQYSTSQRQAQVQKPSAIRNPPTSKPESDHRQRLMSETILSLACQRRSRRYVVRFGNAKLRGGRRRVGDPQHPRPSARAPSAQPPPNWQKVEPGAKPFSVSPFSNLSSQDPPKISSSFTARLHIRIETSLAPTKALDQGDREPTTPGAS